MADDTNTAEREAFEAWAKGCGYQSDELARCKLGFVSPAYFNLNTENAWKAWQARASLAASAGSEPVAPYSIDADPLSIRSTVAEAITGALAFGAQGVNPPPEGHWLAPFWKAAREDKEAVRVKRDLRHELQQQCSTWGTYWRGSDAHGVVLSHPQAVELLQNALGVEVEIEIRGCQTCDYTGVIGDVPCPGCSHPSPPEGMAGWKPIETHPRHSDDVQLYCADTGEQFVGFLVQGNKFQVAVSPIGPIACVPTHWRELLAPPLPASEAKEL